MNQKKYNEAKWPYVTSLQISSNSQMINLRLTIPHHHIILLHIAHTSLLIVKCLYLQRGHLDCAHIFVNDADLEL